MNGIVPFTGEPLALDLINTRPVTPDGPVDLLATVDDLRTWLVLQGDRLPAVTEAELGTVTAADLAPLHVVRDHIATAISCVRLGTTPPAGTIKGLNAAMRAAPAIRTLENDGGALITSTHRQGPVVVRLAAHLAEAAADLLADPSAARIRECEAEDCVMLFLPASARRRWCSASRCGNRVRVARYYAKHKHD